MFKWLQQYFAFSAGERRAVTAIIAITLIITTTLYAYRYWLLAQNKPPQYTAQLQAFAKQYTDTVAPYPASLAAINTTTAAASANTLFYFNPNTIGKDDWIKLGLSEKQASSIEKYKAKGGKFYKPEDLKRLYVLSKDDVTRLLPYVTITGPVITAAEMVELNSADSLALEALPGIGPALTHKILAYRAKLGGYVTVEQLKEIQTLPVETYETIKPRLKVNASRAVKLNINTATEGELKLHPYIRRAVAKAIVKHRQTGGNFSSIDDLQAISGINDSILRRVRPYLEIKPKP